MCSARLWKTEQERTGRSINTWFIRTEWRQRTGWESGYQLRRMTGWLEAGAGGWCSVAGGCQVTRWGCRGLQCCSAAGSLLLGSAQYWPGVRGAAAASLATWFICLVPDTEIMMKIINIQIQMIQRELVVFSLKANAYPTLNKFCGTCLQTYILRPTRMVWNPRKYRK